MQINFTVEMKNIHGHTLKERMPDPDEPGKTIEDAVTLKVISVNALLSVEDGMSGKDKAKRYALAIQINQSDETGLDLSIDDIALVKRLVGKNYSPLVVGQAWQILDPKKAEPKEG